MKKRPATVLALSFLTCWLFLTESVWAQSSCGAPSEAYCQGSSSSSSSSGGTVTMSAPSSSATGSFSVDWTIPSSIYSGADGYSKWFELSPQEGTIGQSGSIPFLKPNGSYSFYVKQCLAPNGPPTCTNLAGKTVTVSMPAPPIPAVGAPVVDHDGSYSVTWSSEPTGTAYDAAYGYRYEWRERINDGSWSSFTSAGTAASRTFSKNSGIYEYQAFACGGGGCSAESAVKTVVVVKKPENPGFIVTANIGSIDISWSPGSGYPAGAGARYDLQESVNRESYNNVSDRTNTTATTWSRSPAANTRYRYQVRAWYIWNGQTSPPTDWVTSNEIYLPSGTVYEDYQYDALGRLTQVMEDGWEAGGYCYDAAGNRYQVDTGGGGEECPLEPFPAAPTGLAYTWNCCPTYRISWNAVPGATYYTLKLDNSTYPTVNAPATEYYAAPVDPSQNPPVPVWIQSCNSNGCSNRAYF